MIRSLTVIINQPTSNIVTASNPRWPLLCRNQNLFSPASNLVRFQELHWIPTTKAWPQWGRDEIELHTDYIQERRRHVWIPWRTLVLRGVWNHSAEYRISYASGTRTTRHPDRIHKHQFRKYQPRSLRGVQGTQRVGKPGAFREKAYHRIGY